MAYRGLGALGPVIRVPQGFRPKLYIVFLGLRGVPHEVTKKAHQLGQVV